MRTHRHSTKRPWGLADWFGLATLILLTACSAMLYVRLIATDMGNLEKEEGGNLIGLAAENRMGKPEELGFALATVADERNGYLAGVDVLCDGGSTNGKFFKKSKK